MVAPGAEAVAAAFAPHPTAVQHKAARHRRCDQGRAARARRAIAGPVLVVYADAPLITTASLQRLVAGLPQGQGCGRRAGLRRARSVALRPADRERRRAGEDRREQGRRRGGEGDRLLQFRRDVPRRRADRRAAGRDPATTTSRASSISPMRSASRAPRAIAPSPSKARRRSSRASIRAPSWPSPSGTCSSACARRRWRPA